MSPAEATVVAALTLVALAFGPIGKWIHRRNTRRADAQESAWLHSRERGDK